MASFKTAKKWHIPYGTWITLSYEEAKAFTSSDAKRTIAAALAPMGAYAVAAAAALMAQQGYIAHPGRPFERRSRNYRSLSMPVDITSIPGL